MVSDAYDVRKMGTPHAPLLFGIYPGGEAGSDNSVINGRPDNPIEIERCLNELQGSARSFIVRVYERFSDAANPSRWRPRTPENYERYISNGKLLDLVLMFQSSSGDVKNFLNFARELVERHRGRLFSVQVTEEASFTNGPDAIDGPYPNVLNALVEGVVSVKALLQRTGQSHVLVGFNSTPTFGPSGAFWSRIGEMGGTDFAQAVDYVGLDFFPDVFRAAAPDGQDGDVEGSARYVLETMRSEWLPAAGLSSLIPIHIAEHGWATGPTRTYERQAQVIEKIIRLLWRERQHFNITRYTLFGLRDTDSSTPELDGDIFHHFGIVRDDYSPKAAYEIFRSLVREYAGRIDTRQ